MTSNKDMPAMPSGATHYHKGSFDFRPHFIKVSDNEVLTWLTGFVCDDCWSPIPECDDLENYIALAQLEEKDCE